MASRGPYRDIYRIYLRGGLKADQFRVTPRNNRVSGQVSKPSG